eukprot:PhM_4_TR16785/c0_g1_i1/m.103431
MWLKIKIMMVFFLFHVGSCVKPLLHRVGQHIGQVRHVLHDGVEREGEVVKVSLAHNLAVGRELNRLHIHHATVRNLSVLVAELIQDEQHNHLAIFLRASLQSADLCSVFCDLAVGEHKHQLHNAVCRGSRRRCRAESVLVEVVQRLLQELAELGVALLERERAEHRGAAGGGVEGLVQRMAHLHAVAEREHGDLAHLQQLERDRHERDALEAHVADAVHNHAVTIVDSDCNLVLALRGHRPTQPDLVLAAVRCDVRDELLDVEALARLVVALEAVDHGGLEKAAEVLAKQLREGRAFSVEGLPHLRWVGGVDKIGGIDDVVVIVVVFVVVQHLAVLRCGAHCLVALILVVGVVVGLAFLIVFVGGVLIFLVVITTGVVVRLLLVQFFKQRHILNGVHRRRRQERVLVLGIIFILHDHVRVGVLRV